MREENGAGEARRDARPVEEDRGATSDCDTAPATPDWFLVSDMGTGFRSADDRLWLASEAGSGPPASASPSN